MKVFVGVDTKADVARLLSVGSHELDNLMSRMEKFYREKPIPKSNGKVRTLLIPMGRLRLLQDKIKRHVFAEIKHRPYLHGGVRGRSNITNAREHSGKAAVMKFDIQDYFPSIRPELVRQMYERLGFGGEAAKILTFCTTFRHQLPQGSPTSPAIANLAIARIDARLAGTATEHGLSYTRFVDDGALSGGKRIAGLAKLVTRIICEDGFAVKHGKPEVMFSSDQQVLTGVSLNFRPSVPRAKRAEIRKDIVDCLKAEGSVTPELMGKLNWVTSVKPDTAKRLLKSVRKHKNEKSNTGHRNSAGQRVDRGNGRGNKKSVA